MPAQTTEAPVALEATYKGREFEGVLDIYFYRRIGFWLARFFAWLGLAPSSVTILGGVFGLLAGHLYYYHDVQLNIVGMLLHVFANALDNADGQLARLTNCQSRLGRIFDSVVDHTIFFGIYLHLTLRCLNEGAGPAIWLVVAATCLSHDFQSNAADYARNAYLYFVKGRGHGHFDSSQEVRNDYAGLTWRTNPWEKLLLGLYLNGTREQELLAPGLKLLRKTAQRNFPDDLPGWWQRNYRDLFRPTFRSWGFLMTNTRMILLFLFLLIDRPAWFFWVQLTAFNILLVFLLWQQQSKSRILLTLAAAE